MEYPIVDYNNCSEQVGGAAAFICTECGDGFSHYPDLLNHMVTHGPVDTFSLDCPPNGFGAPLEFALHENGMLTVVDRSVELNYLPANDKPPSPNIVWSQASSQESQPCPVTSPTEDEPLESQHTPLVLPASQPPTSQITPVILSSTKEVRSYSESISRTLVSSRSARFRCETCGQLFNTRAGLQRHQRYRTLDQGFKCTLCCKVFGEREELRQHLQEHAHERFYSCGHCGKRFLNQETLHSHQEERHSKAASKSSKTSKEGQEKSTGKTYPCKLCGLRFFWLSDLQSHLLSHAQGKVVSHACTTPTTKRQLQQDEKARDSLPKIGVPKYTNQRRDSASSLNTSFRPYRCGLCGIRFQQLSDLKLHHLSHQTQDDFLSPEPEPKPKPKHVQSGATTRQQTQSSPPAKEPKPRGRPPRGNQANHNARVYPCKLCHRVFVHSSSLSRHMRYHKGTLHTCVYCGRHFPQRCDVRRHIAMYHNAQGTQSKAETEKAVAESRRDLHLQQPQLKPYIQPQIRQAKEVEKGTSDKRKDNSNYSCGKCGKIFLDSSERDKHGCNSQHPLDAKEAQTPSKPRVTFQCSVCGKGFGLLCVYQRHQRYHRRELSGEIHKCPRCPRRFRQSSSLIRHLETHQSHSPQDDDKEVQTSPTTLCGQDPALVLEHDNEDLEDEEYLEEEEANGSIAAEVLYECTECTQTFSCLVTFLQHQSAHGSDSLA
ncbi:zinc finger protein 678 [Brienomyrus brachyistius]|uniref:zinc finger protein 678 n=1 Tax=Brienomyrus brachyistius TaxID=42636 RepID=UPI0020B28A72|nr:zinc finger protein 678 [Brienomyrus brachyistius]XP_048880227.1 zinc finger protein 678 [Brienomyrus brachyistius]XP_048880228.1 zinc finger protein 678 [Brienomyrus brachyistius]